MSKKICLKLNLDFIVAEIRGVFESVKVVCVCVNRNLIQPLAAIRNKTTIVIEIVAAATFLFYKCPILNDIRGHFDRKNICQIAGNPI